MKVDIEKTKCKKFEVFLGMPKGLLRCVQPFVFFLEMDGENLRIEIRDECERRIIFTRDSGIEINRVYSIFLDLESLLHIFEGSFLTLRDVIISGDEDGVFYNAFREQIISHRLQCQKPSKYFDIHRDKFLDYEAVLSSDLLSRWHSLREELDVVNQMYLYATGDTGFTIDVICAFLIELSEPLTELIGQPKDSSKYLKDFLENVINRYGKGIFKREIDFGLDKIISCLVNTRVNIMHIRVNKKTSSLNGEESFLYAVKMSYLYRCTILDKLEVKPGIYKNRLAELISYMNNWNGVLEKLFEKIS